MNEYPLLIEGYELRLTCFACPEQYDVYALGNQVAYFRIRHGRFRAECPDVGGTLVYTNSNIDGDGVLTEAERMPELRKAISAVQNWVANKPIDDWNKSWDVEPTLEIGDTCIHELFTDADENKPDQICDRNGQVALSQCKKCGRAENEL